MNGNCPVGAENRANISSVRADIANLRDEVHEMKGDVDKLKLGRARLDGLSTMVVALVAAIASVLGAWLTTHMQ
jgi:hypothetical protein